MVKTKGIRRKDPTDTATHTYNEFPKLHDRAVLVQKVPGLLVVGVIV